MTRRMIPGGACRPWAIGLAVFAAAAASGPGFAQGATDAAPGGSGRGFRVPPASRSTGGGRALGDLVAGPFDVTTPTGDVRCLGAGWFGGTYWVTGTDSPNGPKIYEFDVSGALLNTYVQTTSSPFWGHRDVADGETTGRSELYSGNEQGELNVYDLSTGAAVWVGSVSVNTVQTIRALAVDPKSGRFFSGDFGAPVLEFDGAGFVVRSYPNPGSDVYGAAWDTTSDTLWLHGQDDNGFGNECHFSEYTVGGGVLSFTGREFWGIDFPASNNTAGGADFYPDPRNPDGDTLLAMHQTSPDSLVAYNAVGPMPPPPPTSWPVNLPSGVLALTAAGLLEGFEGHAGTVPVHMAVSELDAATMSFDPEAWCNIGQRGPTVGGQSGIGAYLGAYALEMGLDPAAASYHDVRNALVLRLDSGQQDLELELRAYDHGEESDLFDGVWLSEDGQYWYRSWGDWSRISGLQWATVGPLDLTATAASTAGEFYLMLAQEDDFPLGFLDGVQVDEIRIRPAGSSPTLAVTGLVGGQTATAEVTHATPGGLVYYSSSFGGGGPTTRSAGSCGSVIVGLSPPIRRFGPVSADASGVAVMTLAVPAGASGRAVWIQAFDLASCTPQ